MSAHPAIAMVKAGHTTEALAYLRAVPDTRISIPAVIALLEHRHEWAAIAVLERLPEREGVAA